LVAGAATLAGTLATTTALALALAPPFVIVGKPAFIDDGTRFRVRARLEGLEKTGLTVTVTAVGIPRVVCINPSGASHPPGTLPEPMEVAAKTTISAHAIENGAVIVDVSTPRPPAIPGAPHCPNREWTEGVMDMAFTRALVTFVQGERTLMLRCAFREPTSNSMVRMEEDVTCGQV
jgi:hypothetical protein